MTKQITTGIRTVNIRHLDVRYTSCLIVSTNMMDANVFEIIFDRYWQLCLPAIHIIVYDIRYTACKFKIFCFVWTICILELYSHHTQGSKSRNWFLKSKPFSDIKWENSRMRESNCEKAILKSPPWQVTLLY